MFNFKLIFRILGLLLIIEGLFMFLAVLVSLLFGDRDFPGIALSGGITIFAGGFTWLGTRGAEHRLIKRDGFLIVTFGWLLFSLFGSVPFLATGYIPDYTNAFFETISGFTTTGASILNDVESLPHGLLFWRSLTQWLGGMGIIVMSLAILPILGIGGMQLFVAEVPGPAPDKLHPRIKDTAKRLWGIYIIFTFVEIILLVLGDMDIFDATCHAFTTMATGGYSTRQASIAHWDSPYIHYVIIVFMFLAGTNFTLSYFALHLKFRKVWENEEFRYYLGFAVLFTVLLTAFLVYSRHSGLEQSFRDSAFQVVSIMTTTGFATVDYMQWWPIGIAIIFMLMFFGGSAGSTGGGIKIMRVSLFLKNSILELKRLIHPSAVIPMRMNRTLVSPEILNNVFAFVSFYILTVIVSVLFISTLGYDLQSSLGAVAATLGNIGPGIADVGPTENYAHFPAIGKWFLSFLMLIGRLELFTVLLIFSPDFWKK